MNRNFLLNKWIYKILSFVLLCVVSIGSMGLSVNAASNTQTYNISWNNKVLSFNYGDEHAQKTWRTYRTLGYSITVATINAGMLYDLIYGGYDGAGMSYTQFMYDLSPTEAQVVSLADPSPNFGYWFIPRTSVAQNIDTNWDTSGLDTRSSQFDWDTVATIMNHTAASEMFPFLAKDAAFLKIPGYCTAKGHEGEMGMGDMLAAGILGVYFDGVMTYCTYGTSAGTFSTKPDGTASIHGKVYGASYLTTYTTMSNRPVLNIDDFLNLGWGSKTQTAIKSRFRKYFCFNNQIDVVKDGSVKPNPEPPEEAGDDEPEYGIEYQSGRLTPYAYTYHYSNTYDVGEAIPSGETITNGYEADRWYGAYAYTRYKKSKTYNLKYEAKYQTNDIVGYTPDVYQMVNGVRTKVGGGDPIYSWVTHFKTVTVSTTRSGSYYAVTACNIYELQTVTVKNGAYDVLTYNSDYGTLPVDCIVNGEVPRSSNASFVADENYHIQFADQTDNTYGTKDYGHGEPSDATVRNDFQNAADSEASLTVTVRNDRLIVDGKTYMNEYQQTDHTNEMVYADPSGPHPTKGNRYAPKDIVLDDNDNLSDGEAYKTDVKTLRTKDGDFGQIRKAEQTTTIPTSKANGAYPTTLNATYQSRIPNNGSRTDTDNKTGEQVIRPADPGTATEDLKNYKQNEPVIVHTPVVSPATILNTDKSDASENKTQLVKDPGAVVTVLNEDGIKQTKPLAKLRLDGTYMIEFDPYQWLSEKLDKYIEDRVNQVAQDKYDAAIAANKSEAVAQGLKQAILDKYAVAKQKSGNGASSGVSQTGKYTSNPDGYDGYLEEGYGYSVYNEFVRKKEVRFPFDVAVVDQSTGKETYLTVNSSTGYTDWYDISSVNDYAVKFYIPSWAEESTTKFGNNNTNADGTYNGYEIQLKVTAYNAPSDSSELAEDTSNRKLEKYIATFSTPVNVSGWIYNFQIVGTNDKDMFAGYNENASEKTDYAFALNKEEKKSGTTNRLGGAYVRYTLDDTVTNNWSTKNVTPTHPASGSVKGSSDVYSNMGVFWKGTTFSYSVKTIANLADTTDKIVIKPTLKFYDGDLNYIGDTSDGNLKVYYSDKNGNFIEYGSDRDKNNVKNVSLSSDQFKGSWLQGLGNDSFLSNEQKSKLPAGYNLDNELSYTAEKYSITTDELLNRKTDSYTLSSIVLNPDTRLYTGNSDQLARNMEHVSTDAGYDKTPQNNASEDTFRKSMQTWYGQYTIPDKLYVTTQTELNKVGDVNGDGKTDLTDYSLKKPLSNDSDLWKKTGYIVINFGITTENNGVTHLTYNGGSDGSHTDMWTTENQMKKITLPKQTPEPGTGTNTTDPKYGTGTINLQSGDIAIVDTRYSLSDKYSAHIFIIN